MKQHVCSQGFFDDKKIDEAKLKTLSIAELSQCEMQNVSGGFVGRKALWFGTSLAILAGTQLTSRGRIMAVLNILNVGVNVFLYGMFTSSEKPTQDNAFSTAIHAALDKMAVPASTAVVHFFGITAIVDYFYPSEE